jgi:predicted nuclease of predicted toxin-antitoxin system
MKLLANENIAAALVTGLRSAQHDVAWVAETAPGSSDLQVISLAIGQQRLLLTFDRDFWGHSAASIHGRSAASDTVCGQSSGLAR